MADDQSQNDEKRRPARRRRVSYDDAANGLRNKVGIRRLGLDETQLDPNMSYRYVKDEKGNVERKYSEDWDVVEDPNGQLAPASANTQQSGLQRHGGSNENGQEVKMVLMQKPRDLYDEDRDRTHYAKVRQRRDAMRRQGPSTVDEAYVPDGARAAVKTG